MKTITFNIWQEWDRRLSIMGWLTGFLLMAPPTARTALGFPAISARRLYDTVSPNFTSLRRTCSTWLVKVSVIGGGGGGQTGWVRDSSWLNQTHIYNNIVFSHIEIIRWCSIWNILYVSSKYESLFPFSTHSLITKAEAWKSQFDLSKKKKKKKK